MRDYAKVSPTFWTGETGKKIRDMGRDAQVVAVYLMTCPNSNMIGLYYLPLPTLCHEVNISQQGALKALRSLSEGGFAYYDPPSEYVFVPEMAKYQIGEPLSPNDNRVKGIKNELQAMRKVIYFNNFLERYRESFHLQEISPSKAPCKPLRSQEQEQEQEQEQKKEYCPNSQELQISELLFSLIQARDPKAKKPDFQKWAKHIDLLIRLDKRDPDEIRKVIEWSQHSDFWKNNILSTEKLRKQFTQLKLKMDEETPWYAQNSK